MANERLPNERYPDNTYRPDITGGPDMTGTDYGRSARLDAQLQPDPELAEGPASTGKIVAYAVGLAILLGAVFYGLNNSSVHNDQASTAPASQSASTQPANKGAAPNNAAGVTTGSATDKTVPSSPTAGGQNNNDTK